MNGKMVGRIGMMVGVFEEAKMFILSIGEDEMIGLSHTAQP